MDLEIKEIFLISINICLGVLYLIPNLRIYRPINFVSFLLINTLIIFSNYLTLAVLIFGIGLFFEFLGRITIQESRKNFIQKLKTGCFLIIGIFPFFLVMQGKVSFEEVGIPTFSFELIYILILAVLILAMLIKKGLKWD